MKLIKILIALIAVVAITNSVDAKSKKEIKKVTYSCEMDCESCETKIKKNIPYEKGVKSVTTDMEAQTVTIEYRADKNSDEKIQDALVKLGFKDAEVKSCNAKKRKGCCAGH